MAESSVDKMDMSLDQIIKLQRKETKQNRDEAGTSGTRGRGRGRGGFGRGRGRGRGMGRGSASMSGTVGGRFGQGGRRGGKLGIRATSVARGLMTRGRGFGGRGRGRMTAFQQRAARAIVKRAIIQNRRFAGTAGRNQDQGAGAGGARTQRLLADVRHWRNTAKQLQQALNVQQRGQRRGRIRGAISNTSLNTRQRVTSAGLSDVKQRLGWRGNTGHGRGQRGRGYTRQRGLGRQAGGNVKGRGTFGQMQSDLIIQNRQVSMRQQRLQQAGDNARILRQQRIGQFRNIGRGADSFDTSPRRFGGGRGRGGRFGGGRGRGGQARGRGFSSFQNRNYESGFSRGGTSRPSLNERFGGCSTPVVRVSTNKSGRRTRQIYF